MFNFRWELRVNKTAAYQLQCEGKSEGSSSKERSCFRLH